MNKNIIPFHGEAYYYDHFLSAIESSHYFEDLINNIDWKHEPIQIFGKMVMQPRLTSWHGDKEVFYSGISMKPSPWTESLNEIKEKLEAKTKLKFTSALLNLYRDGNDSVGWHRDNEKELGKNPIIASISLGCSRTFFLRDYKNKKEKVSIDLENGSLLLMKGETQHFWEHSIPKRKRVTEPRINITFRIMK